MANLRSTALLVSLSTVPFFLSLLSFHPDRFVAHPIQHFFLGLAPWWLAYLSAKWYVRLAERASSLYHPLGCLAQSFIWVFHWVVSVYHAFFVSAYTVRTYLFTIFCTGVVVFTEGLFYNLISMGASDPTALGVYNSARKTYGRGLIIFIKAWYIIDAWSPQQAQHWDSERMPAKQSRSMTL